MPVVFGQYVMAVTLAISSHTTFQQMVTALVLQVIILANDKQIT